MRQLFTFALFVSLALGAGCAPQSPMTPEEIAAERARQLEIGTRFYPGKTPEEVLLAAARLFSLADDEYTVSHAANAIQAKRSWWFYVLALNSGTDDWTVSVAEQEGGTKVITSCVSETKQLRTGPKIMTDEKLYALFYNRLDYLLGLSQVWRTCNEAKKGVWDGSLNPLCQVATDRTPDGRSSAQRREAAK